MSTENREYEVEELVQLHERLMENVGQLSMDAKAQIEKLKGFAVADEIASDISDVTNPFIRILFKNEWVSQKQMNMFENIERKLEAMSRNKELWNDLALMESPEWEECRNLGKELLKSLEQ